MTQLNPLGKNHSSFESISDVEKLELSFEDPFITQNNNSILCDSESSIESKILENENVLELSLIDLNASESDSEEFIPDSNKEIDLKTISVKVDLKTVSNQEIELKANSYKEIDLKTVSNNQIDFAVSVAAPSVKED